MPSVFKILYLLTPNVNFFYSYILSMNLPPLYTVGNIGVDGGWLNTAGISIWAGGFMIYPVSEV